MKEFIVEHKYCKATKTIEGYNIYHALKENNLDDNVWIEKK